VHDFLGMAVINRLEKLLYVAAAPDFIDDSALL